MIDLKLRMAKAGVLSFQRMCIQLGIPSTHAHMAIYRGSTRGKAGDYRRRIIAHLEKLAALRGES